MEDGPDGPDGAPNPHPPAPFPPWGKGGMNNGGDIEIEDLRQPVVDAGAQVFPGPFNAQPIQLRLGNNQAGTELPVLNFGEPGPSIVVPHLLVTPPSPGQIVLEQGGINSPIPTPAPRLGVASSFDGAQQDMSLPIPVQAEPGSATWSDILPGKSNSPVLTKLPYTPFNQHAFALPDTPTLQETLAAQRVGGEASSSQSLPLLSSRFSPVPTYMMDGEASSSYSKVEASPFSGKGEVLEIVKGVDYTEFQVSFPNGNSASFKVEDNKIPIYPLEWQPGYQSSTEELTPKASNSPLPTITHQDNSLGEGGKGKGRAID